MLPFGDISGWDKKLSKRLVFKLMFKFYGLALYNIVFKG